MPRLVRWTLIVLVLLASAWVLLLVVGFVAFGFGPGEPGGITGVVDP